MLIPTLFCNFYPENGCQTVYLKRWRYYHRQIFATEPVLLISEHAVDKFLCNNSIAFMVLSILSIGKTNLIIEYHESLLYLSFSMS